MPIYKTCKNGHDLTIEANVYVYPNGKSWCRICRVETSRKYYINNRKKHDDTVRRYKNNNPEKMQEIRRQWRINNPERDAAYYHRRRARKLNQMGEWPMLEAVFIKGLVDTHPNCHYCHNPLNGNHHIEHMTPLARGGLHAPENLTLACPPCNLHKGTMTAEEFMKSP